ncbi:MAG: GNAT family N-acetyltransferase [Planctomycetota bacterium]|jgi:predicted N-acetyltransferase YhbS
MNTTCTLERDLTAEHAEEIRRLQQAAFPGTPEFPTQRWWHTPVDENERWLGARVDGELIGSVRLLFRTIITTGGERAIGGIGNVCSHPDHRGQGAAAACMQAAGQEIAREADFGILFCGEPVRTFYERLGWQVVDNELYVRPAGAAGERVRSTGHGYAMIRPGRLPVEQWPTGEIDLNGPDW